MDSGGDALNEFVAKMLASSNEMIRVHLKRSGQGCRRTYSQASRETVLLEFRERKRVARNSDYFFFPRDFCFGGADFCCGAAAFDPEGCPLAGAASCLGGAADFAGLAGEFAAAAAFLDFSFSGFFFLRFSLALP